MSSASHLLSSFCFIPFAAQLLFELLKYHIVLVPKYSYKVFDREVRQAVKGELKKLCVWMRIEIIEGHVAKDHVHMCLAIPPKYAVSEVIGKLKGKTAIRMFNKYRN